MLDILSFVRSLVFAVIYAGIEYRYVNGREAGSSPGSYEFFEKPILGAFAPYHVFLLFPLFITSAFALPLTAWAGNFFLLVVGEDMAYFGWRQSPVTKGEWTTRFIGSFNVGGMAVPVWWPLAVVFVALLYLAPF